MHCRAQVVTCANPIKQAAAQLKSGAAVRIPPSPRGCLLICPAASVDFFRRLKEPAAGTDRGSDAAQHRIACPGTATICRPEPNAEEDNQSFPGSSAGS